MTFFKELINETNKLVNKVEKAIVEEIKEHVDVNVKRNSDGDLTVSTTFKPFPSLNKRGLHILEFGGNVTVNKKGEIGKVGLKQELYTVKTQSGRDIIGIKGNQNVDIRNGIKLDGKVEGDVLGHLNVNCGGEVQANTKGLGIDVGMGGLITTGWITLDHLRDCMEYLQKYLTKQDTKHSSEVKLYVDSLIRNTMSWFDTVFDGVKAGINISIKKGIVGFTVMAKYGEIDSDGYKLYGLLLGAEIGDYELKGGFYFGSHKKHKYDFMFQAFIPVGVITLIVKVKLGCTEDIAAAIDRSIEQFGDTMEKWLKHLFQMLKKGLNEATKYFKTKQN